MPADLKINYLELPARDLDAVQRFYEGAFGWSFVDYGPEYRAFHDGFIDGGFYRADAASVREDGAALIIRFHFADPNGNELAVWSDPAE